MLQSILDYLFLRSYSKCFIATMKLLNYWFSQSPRRSDRLHGTLLPQWRHAVGGAQNENGDSATRVPVAFLARTLDRDFHLT